MEQELKLLENTSVEQIKKTSLGTILYPLDEEEKKSQEEPLIETLPMNSEQREAVNLSLIML